jgi:tRNA A-37 threonylcarbamoyl transferase component Bud32
MRLPQNYRHAELMVKLVETFSADEPFLVTDAKERGIEVPHGAMMYLRFVGLVRKVEKRLVRNKHGGNRLSIVYSIPRSVHDYITERRESYV